MPLQWLAKSPPVWLSEKPNTPEPVVSVQCMLARNLAGFVFPHRCTDDERGAVEARVLSALDRVSELPPGQYYSASDLDMTALRFLAERHLVPAEFLNAAGPRGLYLSEDQSLAVIVNMDDHILIRALSDAGGLDSLWKTVDDLDTALGSALDYAYHERLGYLTSSLRILGTGLKTMALAHLPALSILGETGPLARKLAAQGMALRGLSPGEPHGPANLKAGDAPVRNCLAAVIEPVVAQSLYTDMGGALHTDLTETAGNLFVLTNADTLGVSETECFFNLEQALDALVQAEQAARERLLAEQRNTLLDSIGRALGIAQGARLLGLRETLRLVSMLRLASALGLVTGCNWMGLNQALIDCQQAHLQYIRGLPPDPVALAGERARIFRALFAGTEMN